MGNFSIERYRPEMAGEWNAFVEESRNGTFLFNRGYMDYHSDRFEDCSWIVSKKDRIVALLPANISSAGVLQSHGGLSYGGWILPKAHTDGADVLEFFTAACGVWRSEGIARLDYKPVPYIYASHPSQEDIYALFRLGAVVTECSLSATIDLAAPGVFNKMQRRHLKNALALGVEVKETNDVAAFHRMLTECLRARHDVDPVHTVGELELLRSRFPHNIRVFAACVDSEMCAGVCVYDTGRVAHAQYIATTERGRQMNMLSPLFHKLITEVFAGRAYFDFGISTEDRGKTLNEGLLRQKYSYGATGTITSRFGLLL